MYDIRYIQQFSRHDTNRIRDSKDENRVGNGLVSNLELKVEYIYEY